MTYVSAVSYPHRLAGWPDPTKNEMVKLALRGYSKLYPSQHTRLPITLPILERIITACNHLSSVCYQRNCYVSFTNIYNIVTLMKIDTKHSFRIGAASWAAAKGNV